METSRKHDNTSVTEEEKRGKDEATLRLIEKIRREVEEEEKLKTDVKQEPITERRSGDHIIWSPWVQYGHQQSHSYQSYMRD